MGIEAFKTWNNWVDYQGNPVIVSKQSEWITADPTFLPPKDTPDGKFHLFAHVMLFGIHHYVSEDGIEWEKTEDKVEPGIRPFLLKEDDTYYLFYEQTFTPMLASIAFSTSKDLIKWSKPKIILKPLTEWEYEGANRVGNPCVVKHKDTYRLYYSAGSVFLRDAMVPEPKYIGVAKAEAIGGPYKRKPTPIISPSKEHIYRNIGAGAIKVLKLGDDWIGFNNGIYRDRHGRNRSAILMLYSADGAVWKDIFKTPIIFSNKGWKRAFVYQLDVRQVDGQYWLYYNGRNGWLAGMEHIGLAILEL